MVGKYGYTKLRKTLIGCISSEDFGPVRHLRGFPELVGSILYEYQPERSHIMDLIRVSFHDLSPNLAFFPRGPGLDPGPGSIGPGPLAQTRLPRGGGWRDFDGGFSGQWASLGPCVAMQAIPGPQTRRGVGKSL